MIILCQNGHICPWGPSTLAACTNGPRTAAKLKKLPFTTVAQDGDDGANITFDIKHFDEVAKFMLPRRKRRLSEEHKRKLLAASTPFKPGHASEASRIDRKEPQT